MDKQVLVPFVEAALYKAEAANDTLWITALKELINTMEVQEADFKDRDAFKILEKADW